MRLARRVADHGHARRQRRGHERILGGHDGRLVHEHLARTQPGGRREDDVALEVVDRAETLERIEVRVESAAADDVAARRGHHGTAEARQQRAREQERGPDQLTQGAIDAGIRFHRARTQRHLVAGAPVDADADALEQLQHRRHVPDARDVRDDDLLLGEQAGGQDRQRGVLVAGGRDASRQRYAAFDNELLHGRERPLKPPRALG